MGGQPTLSHRHAYTGGHSLTEWTRSRLDAGRPAIFGMTWTFAMELAEMPNVIKLDREFTQAFIFRIHGFDAYEMKHAIEQHRGMTSREHKAITVHPDGVFRIKAQQTLPETVD